MGNSLIDRKSGEVVLRCYAVEREPGLFVAVCLDLCLAAQGESIDEARSKLHDQVVGYLHDAAEEKNFERRHAPAQYWLEYYLLKARREFSGAARRANGIGKLFKETMPLVPKVAA